MAYENIKKSLLSIQLEKLMTIKKELLNIKRVSNFFSYNGNETPYFNTYRFIDARIEEYIDNIKDICNDIFSDQDKINEPYRILAEYEKRSNEINVILTGLKYINHQILHFGEETFSQYSPKPYLSRRYSGKAISLFIQYQSDKVLEKDGLSSSIFWDYRDTYNVIDKNVIEAPFYYYELPYLIPSLYHEFNHMILRKSDTHLHKLGVKLQNVLRGTNKDPKMRVILPLKLAEEIVADKVACDLFGVSYFFTLFHTISYKRMHKVFSTKLKPLDLILLSSEDEDKTTASMFEGTYEIHLRLHFLFKYLVKNYSKDIEKLEPSVQKYLQEINDFLQEIFYVPEAIENVTSTMLYSAYKENKEGSGKAFNELVRDIENINNKLMQNDEQIESYSNLGIKETFLDIWTERIENIDKIIHRNSFRKGILKNIYRKATIDTKGFDYLPYELTFYKFKTFNTSNTKDIEKYYKNSTGSNGKDYQIYESFGIYNNISLRKKNEQIDTQKVKKFLLDTCETKEYDTKFYTYKIAMTHLFGNSVNIDPNKELGAIFELQLVNHDAETMGKAVENIRELLHEQSIKYDIYKVLGPNDYVVIIKYVDIDKIFTVKKLFINKGKKSFRRSLTTIFRIYNEIKKSTKSSSTRFVLKSKIRLKYNTNLESLLDNIRLYKDVQCLTGTQDIELTWDTTNYDKVKQEIQNISQHISDIQTFYNESLS